MGIRLVAKDTFKAKVTFFLKDDEGKDEETTFTGVFKRLDSDATKALLNSGKNDTEIVREVLVGWHAVDIDSKEEISFSEQARDALLKQAGVGTNIMMRWVDTNGAARTKN